MDVGPAPRHRLRILVTVCMFGSVTACSVSGVVAQERELPSQSTEGGIPSRQSSPNSRSIQKQASELKKLQLGVGELVVRKFPNSFAAHQVLANVYKTQGDQDGLLKALKACAKVAPERPDIHEQLGIQSQEMDDFSAAAEHYRKSLSIEQNGPVRIRFAEVLLELGNAAEAASLLKDAKPDDDGRVQYLLGEIAFQRGEFEAARGYFTQAIEQVPNQINALYGMVKISTQLNELDKAEVYSEQFERVQSQVAELNQQRRRSYDDIKLLTEKAANTLVEAGRVFYSEKQTAGAIKLWTEAASLDPSNELSRVLLAAHYAADKQPKIAAPRLRELVAIDPNNPLHYEKLGLLLAASGDFEGAEKIFVAMTQVPESGRGLRMLAKFYLNTNKQLPKALALAKQSVEQESNADSHFVYGWALAKNRQFTPARAQLQRAIELDKTNKLYQRLYQSLPPGP